MEVYSICVLIHTDVCVCLCVYSTTNALHYCIWVCVCSYIPGKKQDWIRRADVERERGKEVKRDSRETATGSVCVSVPC